MLGDADKLGELVADDGTVDVPLLALFLTRLENVPAGICTTVEIAATATGVLCGPALIDI